MQRRQKNYVVSYCRNRSTSSTVSVQIKKINNIFYRDNDKINRLSSSKENFVAVAPPNHEALEERRAFPKNNVLAPIVNTNTIKISYGTLQNMGGEISAHKKFLGGEEEAPAPNCNCRAALNHRCPLPNVIH